MHTPGQAMHASGWRERASVHEMLCAQATIACRSTGVMRPRPGRVPAQRPLTPVRGGYRRARTAASPQRHRPGRPSAFFPHGLAASYVSCRLAVFLLDPGADCRKARRLSLSRASAARAKGRTPRARPSPHAVRTTLVSQAGASAPQMRRPYSRGRPWRCARFRRWRPGRESRSVRGPTSVNSALALALAAPAVHASALQVKKQLGGRRMCEQLPQVWLTQFWASRQADHPSSQAAWHACAHPGSQQPSIHSPNAG